MPGTLGSEPIEDFALFAKATVYADGNPWISSGSVPSVQNEVVTRSDQLVENFSLRGVQLLANPGMDGF